MAKLKIIEITTPTCGICKSLAPMVEKVVSIHGDSVVFEKHEIEEWNDPLVKQYTISTVPFFVFLNEETGEEYMQHRGPVSFNVLNQHIVEGKYKAQMNEL